MIDDATFAAFCAFSARLGADPLRVQAAGGNTSIKANGTMWIKASGTELADAETRDIFVAVDRNAARAEARGDGDGSCKATVLDPAVTLRPSIETTFHAALPWPIVAHTHSIATLVHAVSVTGRAEAARKLEGLDPIFVPYAKPGLPLTREILARTNAQSRVIVLESHGLICCGETVEETALVMDDVEQRLHMPMGIAETPPPPESAPPEGFDWAEESWIAQDKSRAAQATQGSYYPDHVVFLGPALPRGNLQADAPAILVDGEGILIRKAATNSQRAMLRCLADLMARLPTNWTPEAIGSEAEAELLNWDAEKYRQALAART
ncbi:MAG: class II aldolase/adducin family protein [Pseudomonadota bacterium]